MFWFTWDLSVSLDDGVSRFTVFWSEGCDKMVLIFDLHNWCYICDSVETSNLIEIFFRNLPSSNFRMFSFWLALRQLESDATWMFSRTVVSISNSQSSLLTPKELPGCPSTPLNHITGLLELSWRKINSQTKIEIQYKKLINI